MPLVHAQPGPAVCTRPRRQRWPRPPRPARSEPALPVPAPDAGRFLVFAMLLFALATWILIMAWMSRYSHMGGTWPPQP